MRFSIERLRWVLAAGALLLVVVLVGYIGYGRLRALQAYRNILKKNGISITHDTNGVVFSQSLQGKKMFTLRAAKATPMGNGKYILHDAALTLYGRVDQRNDVIYGSEIEYDEKEGLARAQGEVLMDLQAPQVLANGRAAGGEAQAGGAGASGVGGEAGGVIHVRTSGLVYLRKLGVAATDQAVEFRYGGIRCTARGAEFNASQSTLRLLSAVVLDGRMRDEPVHMTATSADVDRTKNVANLEVPVVTSAGPDGRMARSAGARHAVIGLRTDGSVERLLASGEVVVRSGTQLLNAAQLEAQMSEDERLTAAHLLGGVVLTDTNPLRPAHGSAQDVRATFTPLGAPASVTATGEPKLSMTEFERGGKAAHSPGLLRELQGGRLVAVFGPGPKQSSARLVELQVSGAARARGETPAGAVPSGEHGKAAAVKTVLVAADELRVRFKPGEAQRPQPESVTGAGHTLLQQDAPLGEQESSTGDSLQGSFTSEGKVMELRSVVQTGHVVVHDRAAAKAGTAGGPQAAGAEVEASAERASYDGGSERLTLTGAAQVQGETAEVSAGLVVLDRRSGEAEATGDVHGTLKNANAGVDAPVTHVLAASARFLKAGKLAQFRGTDAVPAKVWQEASQVQAATLVFDGEQHTFSARPVAAGAQVHAVFAGSAGSQKAGPGSHAAGGSVVRVAGPRMDYNDLRREAVFAGGVQIDSDGGEARAARATVFLASVAKAVGAPRVQTPPANVAANPMGGALERVVLDGDVQLEQPGRHGSGEELVYVAPKTAQALGTAGSYVLTGTAGHPPHIVDEQQGSVTGPTLLFSGAGSTIVVAGEPAAKAAGRVHSEAPVRR